MYDVIVIGAGVSGLMAAGSAGERGASVLLLEKMEKPARKLRITGKGRCNITNTVDRVRFFDKVRSGAEFVRLAFDEFDNASVVRFLDSIGLPTVAERGDRIFPASGRAQDVANAIESWVRKQKVTIECNSRVQEIIVRDGVAVGVRLADGRTIDSKSVILSTGGVSYPSTGSDGDGFEMADNLGHLIVALRPALVPLEVGGSLDSLVGLELRNVNVTLEVDEQVVDSRFGEVVFYESSIAGPTVIALSRTAVDAIIDNKKVVLSLDVKPALSQLKLVNRIEREIEQLQEAPLRILLDKIAPRQLHSEILRQAGLSAKLAIAKLTKGDVENLVGTVKFLKFNVVDYRPFAEAIVTAGGIATSEIDERTMESKRIGRLYFAGEIIDIDADTGGYNIQLALSTGRLAGVSAV